MVYLLAVTRRMREQEEDAGAGNTETEISESTRKFLLDRESLRYRREDEVPAWRKNFLPATQLVFCPGAGLLALMGFFFLSSVEPACGGDRKRRPLVAVRGRRSAVTSRGCELRHDNLQCMENRLRIICVGLPFTETSLVCR